MEKETPSWYDKQVSKIIAYLTKKVEGKKNGIHSLGKNKTIKPEK